MLGVVLHIGRVIIKSGILFKVLKVQNLIREVWIYQQIYIEIDVAEYSTIKHRRFANIAIVVS